jgi:hypothetical protein
MDKSEIAALSKAVTNASDRAQPLGVMRILFDLLSQPTDVDF